MNRFAACPTSFALMRFALCPEEEPADSIASHVLTCAACQRAIAEHRALGQSYMSSPAARRLSQHLDELESRAPTRARPALRPLWAWSGALAAAASLALVVSVASQHLDLAQGDPPAAEPVGEPAALLSPKGQAQLSLWVGDEGVTPTVLGEAAVLRPADRIQPVFASPSQGFVALLLTTPAGQIIKLYPGDQEQSAPWAAQPPAPLGPSFRLDEERGSYRVTAYFSESTFTTTELLTGDPEGHAASFSGLVLVHRFEVRP